MGEKWLLHRNRNPQPSFLQEQSSKERGAVTQGAIPCWFSVLYLIRVPTSSESPGEHVRRRMLGPTLSLPDSIGLGWSLRTCIFNKFSCCPGTTLWETLEDSRFPKSQCHEFSPSLNQRFSKTARFKNHLGRMFSAAPSQVPPLKIVIQRVSTLGEPAVPMMHFEWSRPEVTSTYLEEK